MPGEEGKSGSTGENKKMSFYRNLNYIKNERKSEKKSEKKMAWIIQCIKQGMPKDKILNNLKGTGLTKKWF